MPLDLSDYQPTDDLAIAQTRITCSLVYATPHFLELEKEKIFLANMATSRSSG